MRHPRSVVILALAFLPVAPSAAATITPSCAEWPRVLSGQPAPPHIAIAYDPRYPGAALASAQSLNLVLATAIGVRYESATIPMTRTVDGVWQTEYVPTRQYSPGLSILFFQDDKGRVDKNGQQYWDIPICFKGQADESSVRAQAMSYEGKLLAPGIQRSADPARSIDILQADLKLHPTRYSHYERIWHYEQNPAQVGAEVDAFLDAHGTDPDAMRAATLYVEVAQQQLPPAVIQKLRDKLIALPDAAQLAQHDAFGNVYPVSRDDVARAPKLIAAVRKQAADALADLDYWAITLESVAPAKQQSDFLAFAASHPASPRVPEIYGNVFKSAERLNDVPAASAMLEKWVTVVPDQPFVLLTAAEFYIGKGSNPDRALELIDQASAIYAASLAPTSHSKLPDLSGRIAADRSQALAMKKN